MGHAAGGGAFSRDDPTKGSDIGFHPVIRLGRFFFLNFNAPIFLTPKTFDIFFMTYQKRWRPDPPHPDMSFRSRTTSSIIAHGERVVYW